MNLEFDDGYDFHNDLWNSLLIYCGYVFPHWKKNFEYFKEIKIRNCY